MSIDEIQSRFGVCGRYGEAAVVRDIQTGSMARVAELDPFLKTLRVTRTYADLLDKQTGKIFRVVSYNVLRQRHPKGQGRGADGPRGSGRAIGEPARNY